MLTQQPIDLRLMDIVPEHLQGVEQFAALSAAKLRKQLTTTATTDLRVALEGADFVITAFEVNRYHYWAQDFHIPRKHGFAQIYGENGGPGGMFHALRNMGPLVEVARMMEELCPQAWLINYSNPEAKLVQAVARLTKIKVAGMCHGVFMGREQVSKLLELPEELIETAACVSTTLPGSKVYGTGRRGRIFIRYYARRSGGRTGWHAGTSWRSAVSCSARLGCGRIRARTTAEYLRWAGPFMATEGMQYFYDPAGVQNGAQASPTRLVGDACAPRCVCLRLSRTTHGDAAVWRRACQASVSPPGRA